MRSVSDHRPTDRPTVSLVEEMREEVVFLRREREARVEEKRRHDTIVLQLAQRIPELETPRAERDVSETAPPQSDRGAGGEDA